MTGTEFFIRSCSDVRFGEPMNRYTYYRIGGPAEIYAVPRDTEELNAIINVCKENNIEYFILGKGSNLLVSDSGYEGCVIDMSVNFTDVIADEGLIAAGSGCLLSSAARTAAESSITGFEELAGIPGTVGGALVMNAGCYGKEISELVHTVEILKEGKVIRLNREEIGFGYRHSSLKGEIIIGAVFKLNNGDKEQITEKMNEYSVLRRSKQPLSLPSCGSVFKRPSEGYAGKYIEDCGLKGKTIGGAMISDLHAGFIVNTGNASASDVLGLIKLIKKEVVAKFGVRLEEEVIYLGFKQEELEWIS